MVNYQNGKIYKLTSSKTDKIYVGSTCDELKGRLFGHKNNIKSGSNIASSILVQYDDCKIELIEEFPCKSFDELREREQFYLNTLENIVNKIRAKVKPQQQRTKEYRDNNPKKVKESYKNWRESHGEQEAERQATYFAANKVELQCKHNERNIIVSCPHCQKEIKKYSLPRHIKKFHI